MNRDPSLLPPFLAALAAVVLGFAVPPSHAADISWTNSAGGNWSTAANWDSLRVPGPTDYAVISLSGTYTVVLDVNASVAGLTLGGASGGQTLSATRQIVTFSGAGRVMANGVLKVEYNFPSPCRINGLLTLDPGSLLRVEGGLELATPLINYGTIELQGQSASVTSLPSVEVTTLVNETGALIDVQGGGGVRSLNVGLTNKGTLRIGQTLTMGRYDSSHENTGTIELIGGDLYITQSPYWPFTNSGTVDIPAGRLLEFSMGAFNQVAGTLGNGGTLALRSRATSTFSTALGLGTLRVWDHSTVSLGVDLSTANTELDLDLATINGPGTVTNAAGRIIVLNSSTMNANLVNQGELQVRADVSPCRINGLLTLDPGSLLRVEGGLELATPLINYGTMELQGQSASVTSLPSVEVTTLVNETGALIDVQGGGGVRSLNVGLTNKGTLRIGQTLTMGRYDSSHENTGTIELIGGDLYITQSPYWPFTNSGTVDIPAGRLLEFSLGAFNHVAGTLGNGGTLTLRGATSTFSTALGLGTLRVWDHSTASLGVDLSTANTELDLDLATINGPGTVTNALGKTLDLNSSTMNANLTNQGELLVHSTDTSPSSINGQLSTVTGSALRLLSGGLTLANGFENNGIIEAAAPYPGASVRIMSGTLTNHSSLALNGGDFALTGSFSNTGTVYVPAGRTLSVERGAFNHSGTLAGGGKLFLNEVTGSIGAGFSLSELRTNGFTVLGLDVPLSIGSATLYLSQTTLNGPGSLTNPLGGTVKLGYSATINAAFVNQGRVVVQGITNSPSRLNGPVTTATGSTIRLENITENEPALLAVQTGFTNNGTIELIDLPPYGYGATLEVANGTLVNAAGAAINILAGERGPRNLNIALDNRGTVSVATGATVYTPVGANHANSGTITLSGGNLQIEQGAVPGPSSFTNTGSINILSGRTLTVRTGVFNHNAGAISGSGAFVLGTTGTLNAGLNVGTLTLNGSTVNLGVSLFTGTTNWKIYGSTLNGPGSLSNSAGKTVEMRSSTINAALENRGIILVQFGTTSYINGPLTTVAGSILRVRGNPLVVADGFNNNGTIELTDILTPAVGRLEVTNGILVNALGSTIYALAGSGGARQLAANLDNRGSFTVIAPLTIEKSNAAHLNSGTLDVSGGNLTVIGASSFTNSGTVKIGSERSVTITGGTVVNATSGRIQGTGTLNVSGTVLTNAGSLVPGASAGVMNVIGDMVEGSTGVVDVEIGGPDPGVGYDRLSLTGNASLGGVLNVSLIGGFVPGSGQSFTVMTYGSHTGTFEGINGLVLDGGRTLTPSITDQGVTLTASDLGWSRLWPTGPQPTPRERHSAVYDPGSNRMIVFGGLTNAGAVNETWVLRNANGFGGAPIWLALSTAGGPPGARVSHSTVYDPNTNRMILFGGDDAVGADPMEYGDVWVLSNANGTEPTIPTWSQLSPTGGPPSSRTQHSAVYDPDSNRMIVFGGNPNEGSCNGALNDVWVLTSANGSGTPPSWVALSPSGEPPVGRRQHVAVYDAGNDRMTIFGGDAPCDPAGNDAWVLAHASGQGGTPAWSLLASNTPPLARSGHVAINDETGLVLTVFGGSTPPGTGTLGDAWILTKANGMGTPARWEELHASGGPPSARARASAAGDVVNGQMIVFGGHDGTTRQNDVWVLSRGPGFVVVAVDEPSKGPSITGFSQPPGPNPSRGIVRFAVSVQRPELVRVSIWDAAGRRVAVPYSGELEAGEHRLIWPGTLDSRRRAPAGVYFVRFETQGVHQTRKFVLVR